MLTSKSSATSSTESRSSSIEAKSSLAVSAIDFGTAYSGYAFAFKNDPSAVETKVWKGKSLMSLKTTTSILFKKESFHSFGMTADSKYAELLEEHEEGDNNELQNWHYFKKFKMKLYRQFEKHQSPDQPIGRASRKKIAKTMELFDERGFKMKAVKVFSTAIWYLKDQLMTDIRKRVQMINEDDVMWVLTVPAIWTDAAKQFMFEAATETPAGIPDNRLLLALEPEAAAIHCKQITVQKTGDSEGRDLLSSFLPGEEFLILDMGGGTVDVTVNKVLDDGTLKEIKAPSGGDWGGTKVDEEFIKFLRDVFTNNVWGEFSLQHPSCRYDIDCDFEIKKRHMEEESEYMTIKCPTSLMEKYVEVFRKRLQDDLKSEGHRFQSVAKVSTDKLKVKTSFIHERLFKEPKTKIIEHLDILFKDRCMSSVTTILMVGGFAESEYMQAEIKKHFGNKRFIVPKDPGIAVLKGAVMYGFNPMLISERKSPRTYGISVNEPFDPQTHRVDYKREYDGVVKCENIFKVMVSLGQPLVVGRTVFEDTCRPTYARDRKATIEIYSSTNKCPKYTTDPTCSQVGELILDIPD